MTLFEKRRGAERPGGTEPDRVVALPAGIDGPVAAGPARLPGTGNKNRRDGALAATARVHGLVLVTWNIADVRGCGVRVLDPFIGNPAIRTA